MTIDLAYEIKASVQLYDAERWYDWDLGAMVHMCDADWVFILEYDEELSGEWKADGWRRVLEQTTCTHFWTPRRWIVGERYIKAAPWWPDFQMRLFRGRLLDVRYPERLHDPILVAGTAAALPDLAIHHHVLSLLDRAKREAKVRFYEQLRPSGSLGHYYLYEDHKLPTAPIPPKSALIPWTRALSMRPLSRDEIASVSLTVSNVPSVVRTSELILLDANVQNKSSRDLCSFPPNPVHVAYHWLHSATRDIALFEGQRTALLPCAPRHGDVSVAMSVFAPPEPGDYVLQITIVQEQVAWFEQIQQKIMHAYEVRVIG